MAAFLKAEEMSAKDSTTESQIINQMQDFQNGKAQLSRSFYVLLLFIKLKKQTIKI